MHDGNKTRVAAITPVSIEESWSAVLYKAFKDAERTLGIESTIEHVQYDKLSDAEKIVRGFVEEDYNLIWAHGYYPDAIRAVAEEYPQIAFMGTGRGMSPTIIKKPNYGYIDRNLQDPSFAAGVLAGLLTKTNILGGIASKPIPSEYHCLAAYILGAQWINPKTELAYTFIDSWYDPAKAKEAADNQIKNKADILYTLTPGVLDALTEKGVYAIGFETDQHNVAPKKILTSVLWNLYPAVRDIIIAMKNGTFTSKEWIYRMPEGAANLAPYSELETIISSEVKDKVEKTIKAITNKKFVPPTVEDEFSPGAIKTLLKQLPKAETIVG